MPGTRPVVRRWLLGAAVKHGRDERLPSAVPNTRKRINGPAVCDAAPWNLLSPDLYGSWPTREVFALLKIKAGHFEKDKLATLRGKTSLRDRNVFTAAARGHTPRVHHSNHYRDKAFRVPPTFEGSRNAESENARPQRATKLNTLRRCDFTQVSGTRLMSNP